MGFAKFLVKSALRNRSMWFWGVFFILFWIALGAYIYPKGAVNIIQYGAADVARLYTADWLTWAAIYMPTGVMVGYLYMLVYSTGAVPYLIRFGRLRPLKYLLSYYVAMTASSLMFTAVVAAIAIPMMWHGLNYNGLHVPIDSVLPASAAGALGFVGSAALGAVFTTSFMFLVFLLALRMPKHTTRIAFIPMVIYFASYYSYLYGVVPRDAIALVPFVSLVGLGVGTYAGYGDAPTQLMPDISYGRFVAPPTVPAWQVAAGALAWIAALAALSVAIIGRIRYESPELLRAEM
jgi:hypothetical protein